MHGSFPHQSPPSPGSGASPNSATVPPGPASGGNRLLEAHARLAAIDPWSGRERLFEEILAALLAGAGASRGLLLDPAQPARSAASSLDVPAGTRDALAARVARVAARSRSRGVRAALRRRRARAVRDPDHGPGGDGRVPRPRRAARGSGGLRLRHGPHGVAPRHGEDVGEGPEGGFRAEVPGLGAPEPLRRRPLDRAHARPRVPRGRRPHDVRVAPERALGLAPRARAERRGLLRKARGGAASESGCDLRGARRSRPREHAGEPARVPEGRAGREAPPRPDRGRGPPARRPRRRRQGDARRRRRGLHGRRREGREPLREPGGHRARERAPAPRGRREGEDGARDGARRLHPEDDSSRGAAGGPWAPPRGRQPAHEAGRRRLLRRLSARREGERPCASRTSRARAFRRRSSSRPSTRACTSSSRTSRTTCPPSSRA